MADQDTRPEADNNAVPAPAAAESVPGAPESEQDRSVEKTPDPPSTEEPSTVREALNDGASPHPQPQEAASEENRTEAKPSPTPPSTNRDAEEEVGRSKSKADRHVVFNEEVFLADRIFYEPPIDETPAEIHERLYNEGLAKISERQKLHQEKKEKEVLPDENYTFKPTPGKNAARMPSHPTFDDFLQAHEERVKLKAKVWAKKKTKHEKDSMEECTGKPEVGKRSEKLVGKMKAEKRYRDPIRGWRSHFERFVSKSAPPPTDHSTRHPRASAEVFEKLYQESQMRAAAQQIMAQAQEEEMHSTVLHPTALFHDDDSYDSRTPKEVVDSLLERGERTRQRIEERRRLLESQDAECTFTPKTNKLSQKMVQSWSERRSTSQRPRSAPQVEVSPDVTGVPRKQPVTFDVDLFYSKIHRRAMEKEAKLREIKEKKDREGLSECTFRPKTAERFAKPPRALASGTAPSSTKKASAAGGLSPRQAARGQRVRREENYVVDLMAVPQQPAGSSPPTTRTFLDDDGDTDLANLEAELRGVIAEWQSIDA